MQYRVLLRLNFYGFDPGERDDYGSIFKLIASGLSGSIFLTKFIILWLPARFSLTAEIWNIRLAFYCFRYSKSSLALDILLKEAPLTSVVLLLTS